VPAPDDTRILYGEIGEGRPVGRLVLDLFVGLRTERVVGGHGDSWDERFLRDLVVVLMRGARGERGGAGGGGRGSGSGSGSGTGSGGGKRVGRAEAPWVKDICGNYHEHREGSEVGCWARK